MTEDSTETGERPVTGARGADRLDREIRFGAFQFYPGRGLLLRQGTPIKIGSRALSLLAAIAERPGQFVDNATLMAAGWPTTTVEEANLRVQMAALRRLLDEGRTDGMSHIANAPGRGYALTVLSTDGGPPPVADRTRVPLGLSSPLTPLLGRADAVASVLDRIARHRCVSIVGPGGIGKTRVAIAAAWSVVDAGDRHVCFVDLAPVSAPEVVDTTVAATLRLDDAPDLTPRERIARMLRHQPALLILDNCEHVLDATARLVEDLLITVPNLTILATSREPLLVAGEATIRLAGLALPEADAPPPASLAEARAFAAVELLIERATGADSVRFADADVPTLIRVCRRLDGIPLAIELAAPRIEAVGLTALQQHLDSQFTLLNAGRRSALPRHRTLSATMEWSFDMLSADEKALFVALAIFRGPFAGEAVLAVTALPEGTAVGALYGLVSKSLVVTVDMSRSNGGRYRLLETTRGFAEERLRASPEHAAIARRHADHVLAQFRDRRSARPDEGDVGKLYRDVVADVRAAIAWALAADETSLLIRLIVDTAPLWLRLSLLTEYAAVIEAAADRLLADPARITRDVAWLAPSLHNAHFNTIGIWPRMFSMLERALELAEAHADHSCMLSCLWPMFGIRLTEARYGEALFYAERFAALTMRIGDVPQQAMGHRIVGLSLWRDGQLAAALTHGQSAIAADGENRSSPFNLTFVYRQGVASRANMSNLMWLRGQADQALALADEAVEIGLASDVVGLSYALSQVIVPLAFWVGDDERAETWTGHLLRLAKDSDLGFWHWWGRCYDSALRRLRSDPVEGDDAIVIGRDTMDGLQRHILATILPTLPIAWVTARDGIEARAAPHWCSAELERVAALQSLAAGDHAAARHHLNHALTISADQGALAWELRAATSLAEFDRADDRGRDARARLAAVLARVREGHDTRDVRRATALLAQDG